MEENIRLILSVIFAFQVLWILEKTIKRIRNYMLEGVKDEDILKK